MRPGIESIPVREVGGSTAVGAVAVAGERTVEVFRGIRYARAERFELSHLVEPERGTPVTAPLRVAPQSPNRTGLPASESGCLTLSVWCPQGASRDLPVLVWFHGGGHDSGAAESAEWDGAALAADEQIVVVSAQYRLGALGHLWLADQLGEHYLSSGNAALHDQRVALEWVQRWIFRFGGDPARITVMGQSSGGVCVLAHLAAASAVELFCGAIVHSASADRFGTVEEAVQTRDRFLAIAGLSHSRDLLTAPVEQLLRAQTTLVRELSAGRPTSARPFRPVIDGDVLSARPLAIIGAGGGRGVPLLAGSLRDETRGWSAGMEDPEAIGWFARSFSRGAQELESVWERARHRSPTAPELVDAVIGELAYRVPTRRLLEARVRGGAAETYAFVFDPPGGAGHSGELPMIFHSSTEPSRRLRAAWGSFIRTGRPASEPTWESFATAGKVMLWGAEPFLACDPDAEFGDLVGSRVISEPTRPPSPNG